MTHSAIGLYEILRRRDDHDARRREMRRPAHTLGIDQSITRDARENVRGERESARSSKAAIRTRSRESRRRT